jgi:hypothetical protein
MMNRAEFIALERRHLTRAKEHIRDAEERIERQELLIDALERAGHAAAVSEAKALLFSMRGTLLTMQGHRDLCAAEVARLTTKLH